MPFPVTGNPDIIEWGIEFRIVSTGAQTFETEIERTSAKAGPAPASSAWEFETRLDVGAIYYSARFLVPSTEIQYFRLRHVAEGYTPGAWSTDFGIIPGFVSHNKSKGDAGGLRVQAGDLDDVDDGGDYVKLDTDYADTNRPHRAYSTDGIDMLWSAVLSTEPGSTAVTSLKPTITVADSADGLYSPVRHMEIGSGFDSSAQTFSRAYAAPPSIIFVPQVGISYSTEHTATQFQNMKAISPSVSGFTLRAEVQEADSVTAIVDGYSGGSLSNDSDSITERTSDANTNETTYTVKYTLTTTDMDVLNTLTVELAHNQSGSYVTQASQNYGPGISTGVGAFQQSFTDSIDSTTFIRVRITYANAPGLNTATVTPHTSSQTPPGITYDRVDSGGAAVAMASTTGEAIGWIAQEKG